MNAPWTIRLSRDEVIRAYRDCGSLEEVGQMFGVSRMAIQRRLKQWGVERRPVGGNRGVPTDPKTGRFISVTSALSSP